MYRGTDVTLGGARLTVLQSLEVSGAFARGDISGVPCRRGTPPPDIPSEQDTCNTPPEPAGTSHSPWVIDDDDCAHALAASTIPRSCRLNFYGIRQRLMHVLAFDFLLHANVSKFLEHFRTVFKISPGWRNTYTDHLAKTEVPSPFQGPSGPVPHGQLAVCLTSRTAGAQLLVENIPESSLQPYAPVKKNTLCMVIKGKEGDEGVSVGTILSTIKVSSKEQKVVVKRLDGTPASEESLPLTRVILVESAT